MFHKTELGQCLSDIYEEVGVQKVVELYLDDYVRMVYRVVTGEKDMEYTVCLFIFNDFVIGCSLNDIQFSKLLNSACEEHSY